MSTMDASNQNRPFPPPSSLIGQVFEWVKGQPFNNLVTTILLGSMLYAAYMIYTSIPLHLKAIQDGYERNAVALEKVVNSQAASFAADRELLRAHQKQVIELIIKNKVGSTGPEEE